MTTVVVVHETAAPDTRALVALCPEHLRLLKSAAWAHIDELVGYSSLLACEACALITDLSEDRTNLRWIREARRDVAPHARIAALPASSAVGQMSSPTTA